MRDEWRKLWIALAGALVAVFVLASTLRAQSNPEWTEPFRPFRSAGNLYYVGSKGLANCLKSLPVAIFLGAHGSYFDLDTKYARLKEGAVTPFIDPAGYKRYVADREETFRTELAKQKAALQSGAPPT
jgi:hypothetical protein